MIKKLEKADDSGYAGNIRLLYEVPIIILVATIVLAVYKNALDYATFGLSMILFAVILVILNRTLKSKREKSHQ